MGSGRNYVKRGISYLKRNGLHNTVFKACERLGRDIEEKDYVHTEADGETLNAQKQYRFERPYRFSILVPVYDPDPDLFREMLDSVGEQTYGNWQLVIADASSDGSRRDVVRAFIEDYNLVCNDIYGSIHDKVEYIRLEGNKGISGNTNEALERASGDYVGLLDHDDILENTALFDIMSAIEEKENAVRSADHIMKVMAAYTDEDKISGDGSRYFDPNRKPGPDPVLLCTNNYICHFFVADTNLVKGVGGFRTKFDGAQDHDLILRCMESIKRDQMIHVAKVLYHWRSTEGSTAENPDSKLYAYEAGRLAVSDHLERSGIGARVTQGPHLGFFRLEYDRLRLSVKSLTTERLKNENARDVTEDDCGFAMILSETLKPLDRDYIADMMSCMRFENVGAVTGKIIGRGNRVESAGFNGDGTPRFSGLNRRFSGYMHRADLDQLVDGFSDDCVLVRVDAVKRFAPRIVLKEGYDVYYLPKAEFKRKTV